MVATYVVAPLPNWVCGRCANPDDFMENAGSAIVDFGRFITGFLVVMGIGTLQASVRLLRWSTKQTGVFAVRKERCRDVCVRILTRCNLIALPALLAHCALINYPAMVMSIIGGLLIYGTIISFTMFFQEEQDF